MTQGSMDVRLVLVGWVIGLYLSLIWCLCVSSYQTAQEHRSNNCPQMPHKFMALLIIKGHRYENGWGGGDFRQISHMENEK